MANLVKIITLVENTAPKDQRSLTAEFGLSLYIEVDHKTILFDTGESGALCTNAHKLDIDLQKVDFVVLSHHHDDHSGGLEAFLKTNSKAPVYLRGSADFACYSRGWLHRHHYAGFPSRLLKLYPGRFHWLEQFTEISPNIYIITDFERSYTRPIGNRSQYIKRGDKWIPDPFDHELLLVTRDTQGLNLLTGCSHHGVLNMVKSAREHFPTAQIRSLIGGFHLIGYPFCDIHQARQKEALTIANGLQEYAIEKIYTGHCTSQRSYELLKKVLGDRLSALTTGSMILLNNL